MNFRPLILGGPSGVGKSRIGADLAGQGWLYLEADEYSDGGIDRFGLRESWILFWSHQRPFRLVAELQERSRNHVGVVLTLPSCAVPSPELIVSSAPPFGGGANPRGQVLGFNI